jgi:osmotically inducible protein OsmC
MAEIMSSATIVWKGSVARGGGAVSGERGVFTDVPIDLPTRIGEGAGGKSTPEELLAASHVACLTMSLGTVLAKGRTPAEHIEATSCVVLDTGGERAQISRIVVEVRGVVPGLEQSEFHRAVQEAEQRCLISRVLTGGGVAIDATGTLDPA